MPVTPVKFRSDAGVAGGRLEASYRPAASTSLSHHMVVRILFVGPEKRGISIQVVGLKYVPDSRPEFPTRGCCVGRLPTCSEAFVRDQ